MMEQKTKCEEETPLSSEALNEIVKRKYMEYLKASDAYNKSLSSKFEYLKDKFIRYERFGVEGYIHVRKVFVGKDIDGEWGLFLQGLGFNGNISEYQDDCEFRWSWWTEVKFPKRIYDDDDMLKGCIVIIEENEFRNAFKEFITEVSKAAEDILDNKLDSPDD